VIYVFEKVSLQKLAYSIFERIEVEAVLAYANTDKVDTVLV
jgi:hypothetical protein